MPPVYVKHVEVASAERLPPTLETGTLYFVLDEDMILVKHVGGETRTYGGHTAVKRKSYIHVQQNPSETWTIHHALDVEAGFITLRVVEKSTGDILHGSVNYFDRNKDTLIVTFTQPVAGKAYLKY
jgi:hypothetical protein